jgi:hypothetical protein
MDTSDVVDRGTAVSREDYWAQVQTLRADLARLRAGPGRDRVGAGSPTRPMRVPDPERWHDGR